MRKNEYNIGGLYCIMSENISVTRIVDLPDSQLPIQEMSRMGSMNSGMGGGTGGHKGIDTGFSNTYLPMDVHPNPYGMPPPPPGGIMPPQHTQGRAGVEQPYIPEVPQRLPQRDIPMNMSEHVQDEQIQPNYIPPPPKHTTDYIQEYQYSQDRKIREYEEKKMREKVREHWLDELQIPILIGILYFVFQLPIVNTLVFKRFSFLNIYGEDGNFNIWGLTLKCVMFASIYYSIYKLADLLW